jgi:type I restriction enzyme S subunit
MRASNKSPKSNDWREKYKEPTRPNADNLRFLPAGWVWTGMDQLTDGSKHALKAGPFGSSLKKSSYVPVGYKIYGQEQVIKGDPYYGNYFIDEHKYEELASCAVKPGDVLISLVGTTGRVLVIPEGAHAGIINPRLIKITPHHSVRPNYLKLFLESPDVRAFFRIAAHGETMDVLNLGILRKLPIPLPPQAEQDRIVAEVEHRVSVLDQQEIILPLSIDRAERMRQSILKRAFEGKLVQQDPNDESASALLERIRAERREVQGNAPMPKFRKSRKNGYGKRDERQFRRVDR